MYAIVETGGKQYKVNKGMEFVVESLGKKEGSTVNLPHVMLASKGKKIYIGTPYIKKAKVVCDVLNKEKSDKIVSFKYRRRKSSKTKKGHRQEYTRLKVNDIVIDES
jgi:large subunit ribosomal protein L21